MSKLWNAVNPLDIPTHDGSWQPTHPSVIDFLLEHGISQWAGFRYWMAFTPYPNANDEHEDPNVVASHDGVIWEVPTGLTNPLDDLGGLNYNADTDMVYDPIEDCLRIYYRSYLDDGIGNKSLELRMVKLLSDMRVTSPIVSIELNPYIEAEDKIRSQSIWRESETRWHMWANGGGRSNGGYWLWYLFSEDGLNWGTPKQCVDNAGNDPFIAKGFENWHPSCKPNYSENRIEFLVVDFINQNLLFATCPMDNPTLVTLPLEGSVLKPAPSGRWDAKRLYRSSFTIEEKDGDYFYHLWYSGISDGNAWNIGYTNGYLTRVNPMPISTDITPVAYLMFFVKGKEISLPIYPESVYPFSPYKVFYKNQICSFNLVDVDNQRASPLRIYINNEIKAVSY